MEEIKPELEVISQQKRHIKYKWNDILINFNRTVTSINKALKLETSIKKPNKKTIKILKTLKSIFVRLHNQISRNYKKYAFVGLIKALIPLYDIINNLKYNYVFIAKKPFKVRIYTFPITGAQGGIKSGLIHILVLSAYFDTINNLKDLNKKEIINLLNMMYRRKSIYNIKLKTLPKINLVKLLKLDAKEYLYHYWM